MNPYEARKSQLKSYKYDLNFNSKCEVKKWNLKQVPKIFITI